MELDDFTVGVDFAVVVVVVFWPFVVVVCEVVPALAVVVIDVWAVVPAFFVPVEEEWVVEQVKLLLTVLI